MKSKIVVVEAARTFASRHPEPMRLDVVDRSERRPLCELYFPAYDVNTWRSLALAFALEKPTLLAYMQTGRPL